MLIWELTREERVCSKEQGVDGWTASERADATCNLVKGTSRNRIDTGHWRRAFSQWASCESINGLIGE